MHISTSDKLDELPADGTYYSAGDSIGDALVLGYDTAAVFESGEILKENSMYYVYVVATNSFCFYGPKYNTASPLTAAVATRTSKPSGITVTGCDTAYVQLSAQSNAAGDDILVGYTTVPKKNDWGQTIAGGTFGVPGGDMAAGDSIDGGGYVAYSGPASGDIRVSGLKANTPYHFTVWSRGKDGRYSSDTVSVSTTSAGIVPWKPNLTNMAQYDSPVGWNMVGDWKKQDDVTIENQIRTADTQNGLVNWIETPPVYLAEGTNRLVFEILMKEFSNHAYYPYAMRDRDNVSIQVSEDGKNYTTVMTYDAGNPLKFTSTESTLKLYVPFTEYAGKKVWLRFYFNVYGPPTITLTNMRIERKGDCDYPVDLIVSEEDVVGDEAVVTWTPQGEEDAWEVRYKKSADTEWGDIITTRESKCALTGLAGTTEYDVQVRARCSAFSQSDWSETLTFKSGLAVPFAVDFTKETELAGKWRYEKGVLGSPTELEESNGWMFSSSMRGGNMVLNSKDGAMDEWLITPKTNLGDENVNFIVEFTLQNRQDNDPASDTSLRLVVADSEDNLSEDGVILTIPRGELPEAYASKTYTAMLRGVRGKTRLALYAHNTTGRSPMMTLNNLSVSYSCPNDAELEIDTVGNDTLHARLTGTAEEWLVFVREKGETARDYVKTTDDEIALHGLDSRTTYEIGISRVTPLP